MKTIAVSLSVALILIGFAHAQSPASQGGAAKALSAEQVRSLIEKLGAEDAKTRQAAQQELTEAGPAVLPALAEAIKSDDAEVKARAEACTLEIKARIARAASEELAKQYAWSYLIEKGAITTPVVSGGMAYVMGLDKQLQAVDIKTGKKVWAAALIPGFSFAQTSVNEKVVVAVVQYTLTVYDVRDGNQLWQTGLAPANPTEPVAPGSAGQAWVAGEWVLARIGNDHLKAFKAVTGEDAWEMDCPQQPNPSNFIIANGIAYMIKPQSVAAVDLATRKELWSYDLANGMSLVLGGQTLCCLTRDGKMVAMSLKGEKLWEASLPVGKTPASSARAVALLDGGRVYVGTGEELTSWDLKRGAEATVKLDLNVGSDEDGGSIAPARRGKGQVKWTVCQGTIYAACNDGLFALDGKTGARLWRLPLAMPPSGGLVVADGVIYFGTRPLNSAMPAPDANALPKDLPGLHALKLTKPKGG